MRELDADRIARQRARRRGRIQTVLGLIEPASLGATLMHEHLLLDESKLAPPPADPELRRLYESPLTPQILTRIRYEGLENRDDYVLGDIEMMLAEIAPFKADMPGIRREQPHKAPRQRRFSGTGFPNDAKRRSPRQLERHIAQRMNRAFPAPEKAAAAIGF